MTNKSGRVPIQKVPGRKPGWSMSEERKHSQSIAMKAIWDKRIALRGKYNERNHT